MGENNGWGLAGKLHFPALGRMRGAQSQDGEQAQKSGNEGNWWDGRLERQAGPDHTLPFWPQSGLDFILNENKWIYSHVSEKPLNCCRQRSNRFWSAFEKQHWYPETAVGRARCGAWERWQKDQVGSSDALNALKTCFLYTVLMTFPFVIVIIVLICISLSHHQDYTFLTTETVSHR